MKNNRFDYQSVAGDYQSRAMLSGPRMQRFWHAGKLVAFDLLMEQFKAEFISAKTIVEVGCGSGLLIQHLAQVGKQFYGVDINFRALQYLNTQMKIMEKQSCYKSVYALGQVMPFESKSVDWVILSEVIEHFENPEILIHEMARILKPEGMIYITTPNYNSNWVWLEKIIDLLNKAPKMEGEQHISRFNMEILRILLSDWKIETMGTFYLFSPWLSFISRKLATKKLTLEIKDAIQDGMLLYCFARNKKYS